MREALKKLPGVTEVIPDVETQTATCTVDPTKFDEKKAISVLAEIGFEGSEVIKDQPKKEDSPAGITTFRK